MENKYLTKNFLILFCLYIYTDIYIYMINKIIGVWGLAWASFEK